MAARFKIGAKVYELAELGKPTLRTIMVFNRDAAEWGFDFNRLTDVMTASEEIDPMTLNGAMLLGTVVWLSRRAAGDDVSLDEALDLDLSEFQWLPDPEDHADPTRAGAKKAPAKKAAKPKASDQVVDPTPDVDD